MSFDYSTLVSQVRRLTNDLATSHTDIKESTDKDSYYVVLTEEGQATPYPSGVVINGIPLADSGYTVTDNVMKFNTLITAGSEVFVHYTSVDRSDSLIIEYIGDTIHNVVEPIFNTDFNFGVDTATETITNDDVDNDLRALFVHGTALQLLGVNLIEAGEDAIYIKDGDTVINTAASAQEKSRGFAPIYRRWLDLLQTVKTNRFSGVIQY